MTRPPPLFWSLVATAVVFWPALSGRHVYDDDLLIRQNVALREFLPLRLVTEPYFAGQVGYWRPVASLLMSAAHALAGLAGIHALVLVAHAFAGAVAFRLGVRLFGDARAAAAAAACFLFHPAQVESVSWASAASGPLAGLGTLLAIAAALRWRDRGDGLPWLVALTWFLALLARESAIVGLLLIPAFVAWAPGRTRPVRWRPLLALVGAAALAWGALRLAVLAQPFGTLGAAAGEPADAWRLVAAPAELLLRHLRLLAVPYPLTAFHPFAERTGAAAAVLFLVAAAGLVGLGLLARRSTAPVRLGCLLAVVPILPFVVHYRILGHHPIAERYLYLSALGLGLLVAAGTAGRRRWFAWALAACFGAASFAQTWVWQEQRCLVAHGLRHAPADALLHVMAGNLELAAGQDGDGAALRRAREAYAEAVALAGDGAAPRDRKARADGRLGLAWCDLFAAQDRNQVDPQRALRDFQLALACDENVAAAWVGMGVAHELARQTQQAERAYRRALSLDRRRPEAWYYLGRLQAESGQVAAARDSLERALAGNPDLGLARALLEQLR